MFKITIPWDDFSKAKIAQITAFCEHYKCTVTHANKLSGELIITSNEEINFFWLGANWNNDYLNQLNKQIAEYKNIIDTYIPKKVSETIY